MEQAQTTDWSFSVPSSILDQKLTANEKLVYMVLCSHMSARERTAWPKVATIAEEASLSKRTVGYALTRLEECGLVKREERKLTNGSNLPNIYTIGRPPAPNAGPPLQEMQAPLQEMQAPPAPHADRTISLELSHLTKESLSIHKFDDEALSHVKMTETEYSELVKFIGSEDAVSDYVYRFAAWIQVQTADKQKKATAYLHIRGWYRQDQARAAAATPARPSYPPRQSSPSGKPSIPVVLPSAPASSRLSPEELEEAKALARHLDERFKNL